MLKGGLNINTKLYWLRVNWFLFCKENGGFDFTTGVHTVPVLLLVIGYLSIMLCASLIFI